MSLSTKSSYLLGLQWLESFKRDLRFAWRNLQASPVVTAVATLSLALGMGANTAMFSILDSLLLRTLPVKDPAALVIVSDGNRSRPRDWSNVVWEQIESRRLFADAAAWSFVELNLGTGVAPRWINAMWASGSFFRTLGVSAFVGRGFSESDDRRGGGPDGPVAVISYGLWQREFGGAEDVVGRAISLERVPFRIIGVMPPDFFGAEVGRTFDIIVPIGTEPLIRGKDSVLKSSGTGFLTIIARLKPDQTVESATASLRAATPEILKATLGEIGELGNRALINFYMGTTFSLVPAATGVSGLRLRYERPLFILLAVAGLVLLIACANIANVLLARAASRRHEFGIRRALGASRLRLAQQLLTESLLLSVLGAAVGLLFAHWAGRLLLRQLETTETLFLDLSLNGRVLLQTAALTLLTTLLFGTLASIRTASIAPIEVLREEGRAIGGSRRTIMTNGLIVVQVALSMMLVVAAGLFARTLQSLLERPLGFDPANVLVVGIDARRSAVQPDARVDFFERARTAAAAVGGVADATVSLLTPLGAGTFNPPVELIGGSDDAMRAPVRSNANLVSPGWFSVYRIPLVAGRDFTDADRRGAPRVAIVSEALGRTLVPGGSPVGQRFTMYAGTPLAHGPFEIVGVAGDTVSRSLREPPGPMYYVPLAQFDYAGKLGIGRMNLSVRAASGSAMALKDSVAAALGRVDPHLGLTFQPLSARISMSITQERVVAILAGAFGGFALLLAALGLYGVTWQTVSRRRYEIGIRVALGAPRGAVIRAVMARVAALVGCGIVLGLLASWWLSPILGSLLHGLAPRDPLTLASAVGTLAGVGFAAAWLPAWRASRIDPATVLRSS